MWWIVWAVLVVAAAGALALLGRDLWQRLKAVGRELHHLTRTVERLDAAGAADPADGSDAAGASGGDGPARHLPGPLRDPGTLEAARATRERLAAERDEARDLRLARAVARWRSTGLLT